MKDQQKTIEYGNKNNLAVARSLHAQPTEGTFGNINNVGGAVILKSI